jgi:hypothetical protein
MAGLAMHGQKNAIAATTPITTAFKFCVGHTKSKKRALESPAGGSVFFDF